MRGMISRGLLRWKLEMHIMFENRLYQLNDLALADDYCNEI